jgi:PhoH-like ATPase
VKDNLNFLLGNSKKRVVSKKDKEQDKEFKHDPIVDMWIEQGKIEVEALTYIRGRSIPNSFILIDEAQNLSIHELKTIITRVGENTKVVVTRDLEQIDNVHVDIFTNSLTYAVEKFKEYAMAGHITLLKGERSPLATLASQIL